VRSEIAASSAEGEEAIIATLRKATFGELALLDGAPHSATATALEPLGDDDAAEAGLPRPARPGPRPARPLLAALVAELRRLTGHVEELHFLDLAGRLAMRLTRLALAAEPGATVRSVSIGHIPSPTWRR
jgi:CRP-like cAMP-binding protein